MGRCGGADGRQRGAVRIAQRDIEHLGVAREVAGRRRADDAAGYTGPVERPAQGHLARPDAQAVADRLERAKQFLEQLPAAEILDDQLVLSLAAVGEGIEGLRLVVESLDMKPPSR